jgi:hypothetical protein
MRPEEINVREVTFRAIAMVAALGAWAIMAKPAFAASLNGRKFLQAQGATVFSSGKVDVPDNAGSLTLTGLVEFNGNGGAKFVAITLNYSATNDFSSGILCKLNTPADVEDNFDEKTGVGTLKITIGKNDGCFVLHTGEAAIPFSDEQFSGRGVTFDLYHGAGASTIVSTASSILDNSGNTINVANVTGSLAPANSTGP